MQYIPITAIQEKMILGQDIVNGSGELLLAGNLVLDQNAVSSLKNLGLSGIYIENEFSKEIKTGHILRPEIRKNALKLVHDMFVTRIEDPVPQEEVEEVIKNVIADVLKNEDIMCNMIDLKTYDDYTYFHSVNVAVLSAALGAGCGMNEYDINILTTAALLHDVGKRFVETEVLSARRGLTEEERRLIIQHPKLGYEYLKDHYEFPTYVYASVLEHHEWYNGGGYPLRHSGNDIPIYARIIKLMDVYDALTSKRPYHEAMSPTEAIEYLLANSGGEFDPGLVDLFMKKMAAYPIGCEVILSDGRTALVMENDSRMLKKPRVKVMETGEELDLKSDSGAGGITILELLL